MTHRNQTPGHGWLILGLVLLALAVGIGRGMLPARPTAATGLIFILIGGVAGGLAIRDLAAAASLRITLTVLLTGLGLVVTKAVVPLAGIPSPRFWAYAGLGFAGTIFLTLGLADRPTAVPPPPSRSPTPSPRPPDSEGPTFIPFDPNHPWFK